MGRLLSNMLSRVFVEYPILTMAAQAKYHSSAENSMTSPTSGFNQDYLPKQQGFKGSWAECV